MRDMSDMSDGEHEAEPIPELLEWPRQPITNRSGYEISALGDAVRQALPDYSRVTIHQLPGGDGYRVEVRR